MIIRKISRRGIWWRFASNVPFYCRPAGRWERALSLKPTASIRLQGDPSDSAATAPKALRAIAVLQRRHDQRKEPRETNTTGIPAGKRKQHRQLIIWQIKRIDSTNLERVKLSKEVSFIYPAAAAQSLVVSNSVWPHRRQPTRLLCPWDSPGKNTGVGCHCLLPCTRAC